MRTSQLLVMRSFKVLLTSYFLFCFSALTAEVVFPTAMQQDVPQWGSNCGPDCTCGCKSGGKCTCGAAGSSGSSYSSEMNSNMVYSSTYGGGIDQGNDGAYNSPGNAFDGANDGGCYQDHGCCSEEGDCVPFPEVETLATYESCCDGGIWLPDDPVLFRPFMADPREITYSVGWRFNDNVMTKNNIDVSFGDSLAVYRWCNVWPWDGELQIELEGALWALFDPCTESAPLMNADYYVGVPITYAIDRWQFRLRGYHISSHIGDEFLLNHPRFDRKNASAEYVDFFISHDLTEEIRLYAGLGYIVAQDIEFVCKPFYSALGAELRLLRMGFMDKKDLLYGCPIFGMHFRQNGEFKKHIDATYILGYEFGKLCGIYRKVRFFIEYHDGYSVEGQFCKLPTNYFSVRMSYGF